jgi:hypothetical protein
LCPYAGIILQILFSSVTIIFQIVIELFSCNASIELT